MKRYEILPAIVVVGYNRKESIIRSMEKIKKARYPEGQINLIVSLDYSERTDDILTTLKDYVWEYGTFQINVNNPKLGLKEHILKCGDLSNQYGAVIILEDDIVVSKNFYIYTCEAIKKYDNSDFVAGIALYSHKWNGYSSTEFMPQNNGYDAFLGQFSITWGQCWTKRQWSCFREWYKNNSIFPTENIELPKLIDTWGEKSWGKYFVKYIVQMQKYYVIPYVAHSTNFSELGEHSQSISTSHQVMLEAFESTKKYVFPEFDSAVKYDVFFERVLDKKREIHGINIADICIDLNVLKRTANGCRYWLTTAIAPAIELVASFGLYTRPIEDNVINEYEGEGIYLYRIPDGKDIKDISIKENYKRVNYELYGIGRRQLVKYLINEAVQLIKRK